MHPIRLRPRSDLSLIGENRTLLGVARNGHLEPETKGGLFVDETRVLSRYRYMVDDVALTLNVGSAVSSHAWLGYFTFAPRSAGAVAGEPPQYVIELMTHRCVSDGMREQLTLTNYTQAAVAFTLTLELGADFCDIAELESGERLYRARADVVVRPQADGAAPLHMLLIDPHLPDWLPALTLENLHVADAVVSLSFRRDESGHTSYEVASLRGKLHVIRQPSPWSLTASLGERARDVLTSLLASTR